MAGSDMSKEYPQKNILSYWEYSWKYSQEDYYKKRFSQSNKNTNENIVIKFCHIS